MKSNSNNNNLFYSPQSITVSWSCIPLQQKYGYIRDERSGSGVESYPYPAKEGQQYVNLNPGCLFVQQPLKKVKGSRGSFKLLLLNYYDSIYNRGRQLEQCKTKLNHILQNKHASLTKKYI